MNSQSGESKGDDKQKEREPAAPLVKQVERPVGGKPTDDDSNEPESATKWERRQYRVQATIAVVGAFSVVIYSAQLWEMRKATEATAIAAKAAEDSVRQAKESSQFDQRPWISASMARLNEPPTLGKKIAVSVQLVNSGRTPAIDVVSAGKMAATDEPLTEAAINTETDERPKSKLVLGPGGGTGEVVIESDAVVEREEQIYALANRITTLYALGYVTYRDVHGNSYKTRFCFRLTGQDGIDKRIMAFCRIGNEIDPR